MHKSVPVRHAPTCARAPLFTNNLQVDAAEVAQGRRSPAVHDEHLKALGHITTLTGLHLNCVTGVTGPGLSHLSHLTSLVSLSLSDGLDAGLVGPSHLMVGAVRVHALFPTPCLCSPAQPALLPATAFLQQRPHAALTHLFPDPLPAPCRLPSAPQALASVLPRLLALDIGRMSQPHDMHGGPLVLPGLPGAGGAGGGGAAGLASTGPMAWGSCLTSFANLRTLGLQAMHSLEPLVRGKTHDKAGCKQASSGVARGGAKAHNRTATHAFNRAIPRAPVLPPAQTLSSLPQLLHLESLDLEGTDLPYGEVMLLLELAAPLTQLRRLRLGEAVLCDAHLHALAGISQLRALALTHVSRFTVAGHRAAVRLTLVCGLRCPCLL